MSFDVDWEKLDDSVAQQIQNILNDQFRNIVKPSYLGNISVSEFSFGTVAPSIELLDVADPFPEFYEHDSHEEESYDDPHATSDYDLDLYESLGIESDASSEVMYYTHTTDEPHRHLPQPLLRPVGYYQLHHPYHHPTFLNPDPRFLRRRSFSFSSSSSHPSLTAPHQRSSSPIKTPEDFQFKLSLKYAGNMRMTVNTELLMNYPTMMFMTLPMKLTVTHVNFEAEAVVALCGGRICYCFLEPKEDSSGNTGGVRSILHDVQIESQVGDATKQVLKNVGKIERFIVDQLRKILEDDLVFPSFHSIEFTN